MRTDLYATLDVAADADAGEIRAAYLRLMRASHPDLRPEDPHAQERAQRLNAAYEILGDEGKRAAYDRLRGARRPASALLVVEPRRAAYSAERGWVQEAFSAAVVRTAVLLLAVGALLLTVAPQ